MFFLFFVHKNNKKKEYMALFPHFYFVLPSFFCNFGFAQVTPSRK